MIDFIFTKKKFKFYTLINVLSLRDEISKIPRNCKMAIFVYDSNDGNLRRCDPATLFLSIT